MAAIPTTHQDLVDKPYPLTLITLMPDGYPQASVVWATRDGNDILVNTERGRLKERNMTRDPRVTLLFVDPADQFRFMEIRGRVQEITEKGALEHRELLGKLYLGPDFKADLSQDKDARVIARIQPIKIYTQG